MDTLFTAMENERKQQVAPLAVRMRPRTLEDVVGQQDAVGPGSWLRAAIEQDNVSSVILYGPAGTGKTSIAHVIAESTKATFVEVSAIGGTVSDLRREIDAAEKRLALNGSRTILFVDEIHRFNRSQQDALLHAVENRTVVLVGATTENPFFEVNSAVDQPLARGRSQGALRRRCGTAGRSGRCRPSRAGRLVYARPGCPQRHRALGGRRRPRIAYHPRACGGHAAARHAREPCRYHEGAGGIALRRTAHCRMTRTRICTTTSYPPSSSPCAAPIPMRRCIGSPV